MAKTISFTLSAPLALGRVDYLQSSRLGAFIRISVSNFGRESISGGDAVASVDRRQLAGKVGTQGKNTIYCDASKALTGTESCQHFYQAAT
jgi:hypothetical protein